MKPRSIFWPLVMIAAGLLWLLTGMGILPAGNLWALAHILPYLLMVLGVGLILRAYWPYAGMLISALTVAGAVLAILYAPQLGWSTAPNWGRVGDFGGSVAGSGVIKTETRELREFNAVSVGYPVEIVIRQGPSQTVTIKAEDNLLPQLRTEIRNGALSIYNSEINLSRRVYPTEPVQIDITVQELRAVDFSGAVHGQIENVEGDSLLVDVSGAGDVIFTDLKVRKLNCDLSGAGNISADGQVEELLLEISGMGDFNGADLQAQTANVDISGAGEARLWVEGQLTAEVSGSGSIGYYGDPQINQDISGAGRVKQIGEK